MPDEEMSFIPATEQPFAEKPEPASEPDGQAEEPAEQAEPDEEPRNLDADDESEPEEGEAEAETDEDAQESDEDDLEDFEWNGQTVRGPKGLKDAVLMQADYTKKTQEVADQRRKLESFEQSLKQRAEASDEEINLRAEAWAIESAIKQYENIDWAAWAQQDPIAAQSARYQYDDLKNRIGESRSKLDEFANKRNQDEQQELVKRVGETREFAKKHIKGFTPEVEKRVLEFALEQGVSPRQLQSNLSPVMFDILHKAMIGAETLKSPGHAPRKQAAPLKTVSSRSNAPVSKSLSDMSMDEYVKARAAQGYKAP